MGNSGVDDIKNFVMSLLLVHFIDDSAWDVYDLYDDLVVESTHIDLMVLLFCGEFLTDSSLIILIQFKYHLFGVGSN